MAGWLTNGLPTLTPDSGYANVDLDSLIPVDTGLADGMSPQTVGLSAFEVAAAGIALMQNTGTSTAAAVTMNVLTGRIVTEALTTAAGATYSFTLTNSAIAATSTVSVVAGMGSSTAGQLAVQSVTPASGSAVIVLENIGTAAVNGTLGMAFHIV